MAENYEYMKLSPVKAEKYIRFQKTNAVRNIGAKLLVWGLIGCFTLVSCRSTVMPCPKLSTSQKKSGLFSDGHNTLKYDRKGRVKK